MCNWGWAKKRCIGYFLWIRVILVLLFLTFFGFLFKGPTVRHPVITISHPMNEFDYNRFYRYQNIVVYRGCYQNMVVYRGCYVMISLQGVQFYYTWKMSAWKMSYLTLIKWHIIPYIQPEYFAKNLISIWSIRGLIRGTITDKSGDQ